MEENKAITITNLEMENVKRVKAVRMQPTAEGLTIIGGRNGQGKTSILDGIVWALGGGRKEPSDPLRDGAETPLLINITLSNGLKVERSGNRSALKVTDPSGQRQGQKILDDLVSALALDLPQFIGAGTKDKARIMLDVLGIGDKLEALDVAEKVAYDKRHSVGQVHTLKDKAAEELPFYPDAPAEPLNVADLFVQQKEIQEHNQKIRDKTADRERLSEQMKSQEQEKQRIEAALKQINEDLKTTYDRINACTEYLQTNRERSIDEINAQLANAATINEMVGANKTKRAAILEAARQKADYDALSLKIEDIREERLGLLEGAKMPLDGLTIQEGELLYNGRHWDCMSGAEQLKVSVCIVRATKPECGFVLMDKLEQMDSETLAEFAAWIKAEGMQVIATRVSTGAECSIIIEDGLEQKTERISK